MTNQVGKQSESRKEVYDTSRIQKLLRMNPPYLTGSSTTEDPEKFMEDLKKVFDIMHFADTKQV